MRPNATYWAFKKRKYVAESCFCHARLRLLLSDSANKVGYSAGGGGGGWNWNWNNNNNNNSANDKSYPEKMDIIKKFVRERLLWMQSDLKSRR